MPIITLLLTMFLVLALFLISKKTQKDPTHYILAKMEHCKNILGNDNCYDNTAKDFLNKFTLAQIFDVFEKNENHPAIFATCHQTMHLIGGNEYKRTKDIKTVMSRCSPVCFEGCYDGVIDEYFYEKSIALSGLDDSTIVKESKGICGKAEDHEHTQLFNQCLHALGHTIMYVTQDDLPRSLKLCDQLTDPHRCHSGAFMQNSYDFKGIDHAKTKYLKEDDPMYPCNTLDDKYKKMCYAKQAQHFFEISGQSWEKTIGLCQQVPNEYQDGCFHKIGILDTYSFSDVKDLNQICLKVQNPKNRDSCIGGVASHIIIRKPGDIDKTIAFCSQVNAENKKTCYAWFGSALRSWEKDQEGLNKTCEKIKDKEYISDCQTANVPVDW